MILVAPTAFKGSHTATAVAAAAARGASAFRYLGVRELPVSAGGPGLIDSLATVGWRLAEEVVVTGPLGSPVRARIIAKEKAAVIESADACGLALLRMEERAPLRTTTFGVGELLMRASMHYEHIVVGLGGSATIDAGLGMAAALGWRLLDERGESVEPCGRAVLQLARIEGGRSPLPPITALADVRSPLFGEHGAARVFGEQKGATPDEVMLFDAGLERVASIMRRDLGVYVAKLPGSGAAGGLAAGLCAFAAARIVSGSSWVLEQLGFDRLLPDAQLVITGEGAFDAQSSMGKITGEVIARAGACGIPVLLVAGHVEGALPKHVYAATSEPASGRAGERAQLDLEAIERLVREALPRLLDH